MRPTELVSCIWLCTIMRYEKNWSKLFTIFSLLLILWADLLAVYSVASSLEVNILL